MKDYTACNVTDIALEVVDRYLGGAHGATNGLRALPEAAYGQLRQEAQDRIEALLTKTRALAKQAEIARCVDHLLAIARQGE